MNKLVLTKVTNRALVADSCSAYLALKKEIETSDDIQNSTHCFIPENSQRCENLKSYNNNFVWCILKVSAVLLC
jgi:hypothetical protein